MRKEHGSALITVILVVLVLSMVGLAAMLFMGVEDRLSGSDRLDKEAFYAAESGLRVGEASLFANISGGSSITRLLQHVSVASTVAVTPGVPQQPPAYDLSHLGTYLTNATTGAELASQNVPYTSPTGSQMDGRAYYSLYVRNNIDDYGGTPTIDQDGKVDLISVGWIQSPAGVPLAAKVLEEEFNLNASANPGTQENGNQSGTNAGTAGG